MAAKMVYRTRKQSAVLRAKIAGMLKGRADLDYTQIGAKCRVSREYVRQVAKGLGMEPGRERLSGIVAERRAEQFRLKRVQIVRWLREIGCDWCSTCRQAFPVCEMSKGRNSECKSCSAMKMWEYLHGLSGDLEYGARRLRYEEGAQRDWNIGEWVKVNGSVGGGLITVEGRKKLAKAQQRRWAEASPEERRKAANRMLAGKRAKSGKRTSWVVKMWTGILRRIAS